VKEKMGYFLGKRSLSAFKWMARGEELAFPKQDTFLDLKLLHHIEG